MSFSVNEGRIVDAGGQAFLSLGLNHVEETNLKYPHNIDIWRQKYGSRQQWIEEGALRDLASWGFNTLGWTQEWVSGDLQALGDWSVRNDCRHSDPWTAPELRNAGVPYVAQMRVQELEDWNGFPHFRRLDRDFGDWCDYLARKVAAEHVDSPNLLGYFFVDIPAWTPRPGQDPSDAPLGDVTGTKLYDLASRYYETITTSVRRYDPHHLILGDRYNGNRGIPEEVLRAMMPFVDVLSVQYFVGPDESGRQGMISDLARWSAFSDDKPVILADIGNWTPTRRNPGRHGLVDHAARGEHYRDTLYALAKEPWFAGMHWCGYLENDARGWGLKDPYDLPYEDFTRAVTQSNKAAMAEFTNRQSVAHSRTNNEEKAKE